MPDYLKQLHTALQEWTSNAVDKGWLSAHAINQLDTTTVATPGALFNQPNRPLVVGLFGGTGVGKSTLLNRFAGEDIARASVERPTSREITVYLHESVSVDHLPREFPVQQLRTESHANQQYRSVMWIDMPDFDSVEQSNRQLVSQWLPHIDVVIYVVSPDRYRDDNGWRLLLEHGTQHAWIFVINHWDRGDDRQRDDFRQLLSAAGLSDPVLYCTDCRNVSEKNTDEFEALQNTVVALADEQLIAELESRGVVQRLEQFRETTDGFRKQFGGANTFEQLQTQWQSHWQKTANEIVDSTQWKIADTAQHYAEPEPGLLRGLLSRIRGQNSTGTEQTPQADLSAIVDDAYFDRINKTVDEFAQLSTREGLSVTALTLPINALKPDWRNKATDTVNNAVKQSLAAPGTPAHRAIHRTLGWLCWILPLGAMTWIGFRLVNVFRLGANDPAVYLSTNFAVHSGLLLALAWLVPTVLYIKLKPSRQKAAERGINTGLANMNDHIREQVAASISRVSDDKTQTLHELDTILSTGIKFDDATLPHSLQRMLLSDASDPVTG